MKEVSVQKRYYKDLLAIALEYKKTDKAPFISAKGRGEIAQKMLEVAKFHKIDIRKDPTLAHILNTLDVNEYIPFEAFEAVAAILSEIYISTKSS